MAKRKRRTTVTNPIEETDDAAVSSADSNAFSSSDLWLSPEEEEYIPTKPYKKAATAIRKKPAKKAAKPKKTPTAGDIPLQRPPEIDSDDVPIPFKGRIGFVGAMTPFYRHTLTNQGMPEHLPAHLEPPDLLFARMHSKYDPEAGGAGYGALAEHRSRQCPGSGEAHTIQRKIRDKVLEDFVTDVSVCEPQGAWV